MIYKANDKFTATLTSGYTAGQNTLYLSAVPDNVPTILVAAKGTDDETVFEVTGKTVNSVTGVTRLRGANVDLDVTTPVTCLNNQEFVNQYSTAIFSAESLGDIVYAEDGGSNDTYAVSLDPAPTAYAAGQPVIFKANTGNTGAATLNVNSLGAKTIKKNHDEDLADGDIEAGQVIIVVYDGTNFQLQSVVNGVVTPTSTNTLTNKRITKRYTAISSSATPTPNADTDDMYFVLALASGATFGAPTGTPTIGQGLIIRIKDNGTARTLAWNAIYRAIGVVLPTTTVINKTLYVGMIWNGTDSKWDVVAVSLEA